VISNLVRAWRRDQGHELLQQFLGLEDHVRRAVAPAALQAIEETCVGQPGQAFCSNRGPGYVAGEPFQTLAIPGRDGDACMQTEPTSSHTVRPGGLLPHLVRVDAIAATEHLLAGAVAGGDTTADRRSSQPRKEGLVPGEKFDGRLHGPALHEPFHLPRDTSQDPVELVAPRWRQGKEAHASVPCLVDAIQEQRMEVNVQVQSIAKALDVMPSSA
jgi:hypothetical protein